MSWRYTLINKPKTLGEFLDYAINKNKPIIVEYHKHYDECGASTEMIGYFTHFNLLLGKKSLLLKSIDHITPPLPSMAITAREEFNRRDLEEAIKISNSLKGFGIECTIQNNQ